MFQLGSDSTEKEYVIPSDKERPRAQGRQRSSESHRAILAATREILDEVGYFRLTVEGVAARAGVGKTTVYRWWPAKSDLVLEALGAGLAAPPQPTGDLRTDLRAVLAGMLEDLQAPRGAALLALAGERLAARPGDAGPLDLFQADRGAVEHLVEDGARAGELPLDLDAGLLHDILAGTLLYRVLCGRSTNDVLDTLLDLLVDGDTIVRNRGSVRPE